tara:strand:- start:554 stop:1354 length:801 start_codon:yes stop_codon:yes gene_type:complete
MSKLKLDDFEEQIKPTKNMPKVPEVSEIPNGYFQIESLPSKFKLYPDDTKIFSRPLKILEVKQLSMINEENFNEIINSVLSKTIIGIKVDDLIVADKLFIIFWQRANTYKGDSFAIDFKCSECGANSKYNFDIAALNIRDISDTYDPNTIVELPESKIKLTFGQMTVRTEKEADAFLKRKKTADDDMVAIASIITSIDNAQSYIASTYDWLIELGVADIMYLTNAYHKVEIGLDPILNVTCGECGGSAETPISFRADFFLPEYRTE